MLTLLVLVMGSTLVCGLDCDEFASCEPNATPTPRHRPDAQWLESCQCDDQCMSYGDCCPSAPVVKRAQLNEWSILNIKVGPKLSFPALMKTKCPREWKDSRVRGLCEDIGFDEEQDFILMDFGHIVSINKDEFLQWHVTSNATTITYRNIYCAVCNEDTAQLEAWKHKIRCLENGHLSSCSRVYFPYPPDSLSQRKITRKPIIQPQLYSGCNIAWYKTHVAANKSYAVSVAKNCARFYAPVAYQGNRFVTIFKNEYCAICCDYALDTLICPNRVNPSSVVKFPSTWNRDGSYDTDYLKGGKIRDTDDRCAPGHVYDPFRTKCRLIVSQEVMTTSTTAPSTSGHSGHTVKASLSHIQEDAEAFYAAQHPSSNDSSTGRTQAIRVVDPSSAAPSIVSAPLFIPLVIVSFII